MPQTDTNEHVKEASAQSDDAIIPEVSQTDASENVNEVSAQIDDTIIPEVSQTDASEHVKEASAQSDDAIIPEVSQTDATESVNEVSAQNDDVIIPEVSQTDESEHVKEASAQHDDTINSIEEEPQTDEIINSNRDRDRHTISKKNDIDKPSSSWKVSNIAKYVNFDNCIIEIEMSTRVPSNLDNIYEKVRKAINSILKIVKGSDLKLKKGNSDSEFLEKFISKTSIETGSRLVLDALLHPLCTALCLLLEVEKSINCKFLPTCRFDYCIRKKEHITGCIEAKSVWGLSKKSIAQAVLQLLVLQATFTGKVKISKFPFFAIVTDGHRFIYMQLRGSRLGFEHHKGKVMIRKVEKIDDFKAILQQIMCLVEGDVNIID